MSKSYDYDGTRVEKKKKTCHKVEFFRVIETDQDAIFNDDLLFFDEISFRDAERETGK